MGGRDECAQRFVTAKGRIDMVVINGVIFVVGRANVNGIEIDDVDAQLGQIIQMLLDTLEIAARIRATSRSIERIRMTSRATSEAIELTTKAARMGVDGTLQVCPYYNKPSQEGLYQHYKAIAECTDLPMMLYSIPGRSVIEIAVDTIARLAADCPTIIANKEAGGDPERVTQIKTALPDDFQILSGDDPLTIEFMKRGAVGLVSVASNIIPDVMSSLVKAMNDGRTEDAEAIQAKYEPLFKTLMSLDTNPVPIKSAVALQGHCSDELRLPLVNLSAENEATLRQCLTDFELI